VLEQQTAPVCEVLLHTALQQHNGHYITMLLLLLLLLHNISCLLQPQLTPEEHIGCNSRCHSCRILMR
jgi:hypothetical protein